MGNGPLIYNPVQPVGYIQFEGVITPLDVPLVTFLLNSLPAYILRPYLHHSTGPNIGQLRNPNSWSYHTS